MLIQMLKWVELLTVTMNASLRVPLSPSMSTIPQERKKKHKASYQSLSVSLINTS